MIVTHPARKMIDVFASVLAYTINANQTKSTFSEDQSSIWKEYDIDIIKSWETCCLFVHLRSCISYGRAALAILFGICKWGSNSPLFVWFQACCCVGAVRISTTRWKRYDSICLRIFKKISQFFYFSPLKSKHKVECKFLSIVASGNLQLNSQVLRDQRYVNLLSGIISIKMIKWSELYVILNS